MIDIKTISKPKKSGGGSGGSSASKTTYVQGIISEAEHAIRADKAKRAELAEQADYASQAGTAQTANYAQKAGELDEGAEILQRFLRKDIDDEAQGTYLFHQLQRLLKGLQVGDFNLESGGSWTPDAEGRSHLITDYLEVRMKAIFEELVIKKTSTIGGKEIISPAGGNVASKVEEVTVTYDGASQTAYRCYFLAEQDGDEVDNDWAVGDQARSESFNVKKGTYHKAGNHFLWRLVVGRDEEPVEMDGKKYHYIDLSATDCATSSDIPMKGDVLSQCGNRTDVDRQNCLIFSAVDTFSPSIALYHGINSYSFANKEYVEYGVNKQTNKAFFNVYGDMYVGDRPTKDNDYEGESYIKYDSETKKVKIKGELSVSSTVGGKGLSDYIKDNAPKGLSESDVTTIINNSQVIEDLQNQIDGAIETWFHDGEPTLSNAPAKDWKTDKDKNIHLGDLYYDNLTGKAYRFAKDGDTYQWTVITDTDITKALTNAAKAQETADGKMTVFSTQPKPPYQLGDIWVNATYGSTYKNDVLRCKTTKTSGTFSIDDWMLASKYTDDTVANEAKRLAQAAQKDIETTQGDLTKLGTTVSDNKTAFDSYVFDGYLEPSEIAAMIQDSKRLEDDFAAAEKSYNEVKDSEVLKSTTQLTALVSAFGTFKTAKEELITYLADIATRYNAADDNGKKTIVAAVGTKYTNFQSAYSAFYDKLGLANAYITSKIYGDLNQNITDLAGYRYIKDALGQDTDIKGGLVMATLLALRDADGNIQSGINGAIDPNRKMQSIATWWGGKMIDKDYNNGDDTPATSLIRFDGSGYLANGAIWWDTTGKVHADPTSFIISEKNVGAYLAFFEPTWKTSSDGTNVADLVALTPAAPFTELGVGGNLDVEGKLTLGGITLSVDKDGNLKIDGNVYATGGISAYGSSDAQGGGGLNASVKSYSDIIKGSFSDSDLMTIPNAYSIKALYNAIQSIDVTDQLSSYYTKAEIDAKGFTSNKGTVTSVALTVPTGLSVSGSPITSSGTLAVSFASGYSIPTTTKQKNWDAVYDWYASITKTDTDKVINKWQEIIDFLAGIDSTETLDGIVGGINKSITALDTKMGNLAFYNAITQPEALKVKFSGKNVSDVILDFVHDHSFSEILDRPTTLMGYGIKNIDLDDDSYIDLGGIKLTYDSKYDAWKLDGNFYATGGITAYGEGRGSSSSGGLNGSIIPYAKAILLTEQNEGTEIASAWSVRQLYNAIQNIDVTGQLGDYLTIASAAATYSPKSHTHTVKINGVTKTIAATGGTAVDLGTYLTTHQSLADYAKTAWVNTQLGALAYLTGASFVENGQLKLIGKNTNDIILDFTHEHSFGELLDKPTTLDGYSITDAYTKAEVDDKDSLLRADITTLQGYFTNGSAKSAIKLTNARKLWGNSFDGTADISGSITVPSGKYIAIGNIKMEYDATNKALKITNTTTSEVANLYTSGGVSAYGVSTTSSGNGGLQGSILDYATALKMSAANNGDSSKQENSYLATAWSVKRLYDEIQSIDVTDQLADYLTIKDAKATYATVSHTHNYASSVKLGSTSYAVASNVITLPAYPTALKNPYALTIQRNGTKLDSYDGSAAKTVNIAVPTKMSELTDDLAYLKSAAFKEKGVLTLSGHNVSDIVLDFNHEHSFSELLDKPNTLDGYGIENVVLPADRYIKLGDLKLTYDAANKAWKLDGNFYATGGITAYGEGAASGSGGLNGSVKSYADALKLTSESLTELATAYSIKALDTRISSLEGGSATSITTTGSGNAVTAISKSGTTITVTKGTTFLTSHQSLSAYLKSVDAADLYQPKGNYLTAHQDISGKSDKTHTHSVKINGATKTIAATGGTAVDLGTYLTTHQTIYGLTIQRNGTSLGTYTPNSKAATINVTVPTKLTDLTNDLAYLSGAAFVSHSQVKLTGHNVSDILLDFTHEHSWNEILDKPNTLDGYGIENVSLPADRYIELGGIRIYYDATNKALKVDGNLYATGGLTAYGAGSGTSSGGGLNGSVKSYADAIKLSLESLSEVASAYSIKQLYSKITALESNGYISSVAWADIKSKPSSLSGFGITDGVNSVTVSGSGNAVTSASVSGHTLTLTKGSTFLTSHQSLSAYLKSADAANTYLKLSGGTMNGEIQSSSSNGFRIITESKGAILRFDEYNTFYILHSTEGGGTGAFDSLRPFWITFNDSTVHSEGYMKAKGFVKADSSDSYVLLGDGGHKAISSLSVSYASSAGSAGSVAWGNVSGRPTKVSQFTNDSGYITSSASITGNAGSATKLQTARKLWGQSFNGTADISDEIQVTAANAIRCVQSNKGFLIRNDGSDVWFLVSTESNGYGGFNSLRPMRLKIASGIMEFQNGVESANIIPNATHTYTLGNSSYVWEQIYTRYINTDGYDLRFSVGGTERLHITNDNGYVGIGTESPSCKLDVKGAIQSSDRLISKGEGGVELYQATPYVDFHFGNTSEDYDVRLINESQGVLKLYGNFLCNAGITAYSSSDIRLKHDLQRLDYLGIVRSMGGTFGFRWNKDDEQSIGWIAQHVLGNPYMSDLVETDDKGYLKINYWSPKLIATAFGAIEQVDDEVSRLRARVTFLEAEVERLAGILPAEQRRIETNGVAKTLL